jgi:hypothetical protein
VVVEDGMLVLENGTRLPDTTSVRRELALRYESGYGLEGWGSPAALPFLDEDYDEEDEEDVHLLDPLVAYDREAQRMRQAGPRRRI